MSFYLNYFQNFSYPNNRIHLEVYHQIFLMSLFLFGKNILALLLSPLPRSPKSAEESSSLWNNRKRVYKMVLQTYFSIFFPISNFSPHSSRYSRLVHFASLLTQAKQIYQMERVTNVFDSIPQCYVTIFRDNGGKIFSQLYLIYLLCHWYLLISHTETNTFHILDPVRKHCYNLLLI